MNDGGHVDRRRAPVRCDGCGRSAADAGMSEYGWTISPPAAAVPGGEDDEEEDGADDPASVLE